MMGDDPFAEVKKPIAVDTSGIYGDFEGKEEQTGRTGRAVEATRYLESDVMSMYLGSEVPRSEENAVRLVELVYGLNLDSEQQKEVKSFVSNLESQGMIREAGDGYVLTKEAEEFKPEEWERG